MSKLINLTDKIHIMATPKYSMYIEKLTLIILLGIFLSELFALLLIHIYNNPTNITNITNNTNITNLTVQNHHF